MGSAPLGISPPRQEAVVAVRQSDYRRITRASMPRGPSSARNRPRARARSPGYRRPSGGVGLLAPPWSQSGRAQGRQADRRAGGRAARRPCGLSVRRQLAGPPPDASGYWLRRGRNLAAPGPASRKASSRANGASFVRAKRSAAIRGAAPGVIGLLAPPWPQSGRAQGRKQEGEQEGERRFARAGKEGRRQRGGQGPIEMSGNIQSKGGGDAPARVDDGGNAGIGGAYQRQAHLHRAEARLREVLVGAGYLAEPGVIG